MEKASTILSVIRPVFEGYATTYNTLIVDEVGLGYDNVQTVTDLITDPLIRGICFYPDYDDPNSSEVFRGGNLIFFKFTYILELSEPGSVIFINPTQTINWIRNGPSVACDNPFDCFSIEISSPSLTPPTKIIEGWSSRVKNDDRTVATGITHYPGFKEDRIKIELTVIFKYRLYYPNNAVDFASTFNCHHWLDELPSMKFYGTATDPVPWNDSSDLPIPIGDDDFEIVS